ncbi:MAG: fused MFS/spermidine synthase [Nanoarchaeota archaeon]|nr:fused MFS/spermidine synthase [Nanoarchaeota archaeon]MCG2719177.1 fused MFS/spermidine synthase [Nanoarchaeota archaeon]
MDLRKLLLIAFVFSGAAALIYEVAWTRPLQFVLGSTTYTISIIFAAFMGGLALGSWLMSKYVEKIKNLPKTYALLELGIGLYGILLLTLFNLLPKLYRVIYPLHKSFYFFETSQFLITFLLLLIPTTLMGATWPIIAKYYIKQKVGKGIGEIYSANNLGAIIGGFSAGFLLIPFLGIKLSIIIAALLNIIIGSIILIKISKNLAKKLLPLAFLLFLALAYFGDYNIKEMYSSGFTRTQFSEDLVKQTEFLYYNEGAHATIAVIKDPLEGAIALLINGKGQGSNAMQDMRINYLLAYLPQILVPKIQNALIIGLGTGTTSGHLAQNTQVTTIEIEKSVVETINYFNQMNLDVLNNPNHELIIADGRNYLLKSDQKYDVIIPEPSDPWQSFSTNLYSKEFFELEKKHLKENGIALQWIPIYELNDDDFKSIYATFSSVFPYVIAFANLKINEGFPVELETSEIILIGSNQELFDEESFRNNFNALSSESRAYLDKIWVSSADDLLNLFLFDQEQIEAYSTNAEIVTDDNLKLEFSTSKTILHLEPETTISGIKEFLEKEVVNDKKK